MYQGKFSNKKPSENDSRVKQNQQETEENLNDIQLPDFLQPSDYQRPLKSQKNGDIWFDLSQEDASQQTQIRQQVPAQRRPAQNPVRQPVNRKPSAQDPRLQFNLQFENPSLAFNPDTAGTQPYEDDSPAEPSLPAPRRRVGVLIGGILFYLFLAAGIGLFLLNMNGQLGKLKNELASYEKMQPNYVSHQVFTEIFGSPNWAAIYDNAHLELSEFEGKAAFVKFMEARVGGRSLTYQKMPVLEDGRIQYKIFLDKEPVASFYMKNHSEDPDAPGWQLDGIEVYFEATETYRIQAMSDYVVKVNGVAVNEKNIIQKTGKKFTADLGNLVPSGPIPGTSLYEVGPFLVQPQVTVEDHSGKQLPVAYDEESMTFSVPLTSENVPAEVKDLALNAVKTYCEFMIKKAYVGDLGKYFKPGTATSRAITGSDLTWIQKESGHSTANEKVYDYIPLGEKAYSVRVSLTWQLQRQDGTVKESPVDVTLLFEQENNGKWRCTRMTGKEFVESFNTVRVRFMHEDTVIASFMVNEEDRMIQCPTVGVPEGRKMAGWVMMMQDEEGNDYYQRVLEPDESGKSMVPAGVFHNPVDFYPVHVKES